MRIYLAGKMTEPDWRAALLAPGAAPDVRAHVRRHRRWPILAGALFGRHDFSGPFLMDHTEDLAPPDDPEPPGPPGDGVRRLCCEALRQSDLVFAWINTQSAYGTFAELGYAHALGVPIWLAGPRFFRELWLIYAMAERHDFAAADPAARLAAWLDEA
ncbi:MAG TPA: hypothetical protein VGE07_26535 [Herpetosiphonaceae bacterium]